MYLRIIPHRQEHDSSLSSHPIDTSELIESCRNPRTERSSYYLLSQSPR